MRDEEGEEDKEDEGKNILLWFLVVNIFFLLTQLNLDGWKDHYEKI